ncbi:hypothetical protein [Flavivirga jejuensis]|uniref:Uncharacterized protein n=1 Tax=Flavivirga jejuensis TaxID=870487 RepID=A0ABT8WIS9_9FLAO|nr:hypothetical protein [Flavivirga jejuensis]MDO5973050.1 hypothetical protein [Flavivirga jejuensis]
MKTQSFIKTKTSLVLLFVLLMGAGTLFAQSYSYEIEDTSSGTGGTRVYVVKDSDGNYVGPDSNGSMPFFWYVDDPLAYYITALVDGYYAISITWGSQGYVGLYAIGTGDNDIYADLSLYR